MTGFEGGQQKWGEAIVPVEGVEEGGKNEEEDGEECGIEPAGRLCLVLLRKLGKSWRRRGAG